MHLHINCNELALRSFRDAVSTSFPLLPHCSNAYVLGYTFFTVY